MADAAWAGKQVPSEAEWEWAACGGRQGSEFAWGDELQPGGRPMANTFQGAFPPNGYGLLDMIGNVWEWTDDWYGSHATTIDDPGGCGQEASINPASQHGSLPRKVVKGGSYLCAPSYCRRYRPAARLAEGIDTSTGNMGTGHMGFRCLVRS